MVVCWVFSQACEHRRAVWYMACQGRNYCDCFRSSPLCPVGSCSQVVRERVCLKPCLWHIPQGRGLARSWVSPPSRSRALGRSNGRDWLFQARTGPGVARAQTKAAARDWATKCLHLKHGLSRNLPQAAVSKGLWVNPLEVKNWQIYPLSPPPTPHPPVKPQWMQHLFTGARWGVGRKMEGNIACYRLSYTWAPAQVPAALNICDELQGTFVPRSSPQLFQELVGWGQALPAPHQGLRGIAGGVGGVECCLWHMPRLSVEELLGFWLLLSLAGYWLAAHSSGWLRGLSAGHIILACPGTAVSLLGLCVWPFLHILSVQSSLRPNPEWLKQALKLGSSTVGPGSLSPLSVCCNLAPSSGMSSVLGSWGKEH